MCQPSEEEPDADEVDEGLRRAGQPFVVFTQPALSAQPRKGALQDPPFGDDPESWLLAQIR